MSNLQISEADGIRRICLNRGKVNALDAAFMAEIRSAIEAAERDAARGIILAAEGSTFSAGLDLVALLELERAGMAQTLRELYELSLALFLFPRPVVAAINGHAIAGGAYLTLCCDRRIMAQGNGRWGLNETALGLAMPAHTLPVVSYALGDSLAEKIVYGGTLYPAFKVLDMGILEGLVEVKSMQEEAAELIDEWAHSPHAFADIKSRLKAPAAEAMRQARPADEAWLDLWFSDAAQAKLIATRDELSAKKNV
jgi:enoyl-CoA hydratase